MYNSIKSKCQTCYSYQESLHQGKRVKTLKTRAQTSPKHETVFFFKIFLKNENVKCLHLEKKLSHCRRIEHFTTFSITRILRDKNKGPGTCEISKGIPFETWIDGWFLQGTVQNIHINIDTIVLQRVRLQKNESLFFNPSTPSFYRWG